MQESVSTRARGKTMVAWCPCSEGREATGLPTPESLNCVHGHPLCFLGHCGGTHMAAWSLPSRKASDRRKVFYCRCHPYSSHLVNRNLIQQRTCPALLFVSVPSPHKKSSSEINVFNGLYCSLLIIFICHN